MWTYIQSRVRSALTSLAVLLILTLIVTALVFAMDRPHPTHTYSFQLYDLLFTPAAPWHPGQSLSLLWVPSVQSGPDAPPRSITGHFRLYGPYPTQGDAQADLGRADTPADLSTAAPADYIPLAASAPPLALSTALGTPAPAPVTYVLPAAVTSAYYVAVSSTEVGDTGGWSTAWVTEVVG